MIQKLPGYWSLLRTLLRNPFHTCILFPGHSHCQFLITYSMQTAKSGSGNGLGRKVGSKDIGGEFEGVYGESVVANPT